MGKPGNSKNITSSVNNISGNVSSMEAKQQQLLNSAQKNGNAMSMSNGKYIGYSSVLSSIKANASSEEIFNKMDSAIKMSERRNVTFDYNIQMSGILAGMSEAMRDYGIWEQYSSERLS